MPSRGTTAARARAVGMSVGVALLLGACTSGGPAGPTPPTGIGTVSAPSIPTPTPSPTTDLPRRPAASEAIASFSPEGSDALARYFLALYPYVYATYDLTEWERLSHPECVFCRSVLDRAAERKADGQVTVGGDVTVGELDVELFSDTMHIVRGRLEHADLVITDETGAVVAEEAGASYDFELFVFADDAHPTVRGVDLEPATS